MATPTLIQEEGGVVMKFWSCPIRFIPASVWSFMRYQAFYKKHPSAPFPGLDSLSPRYSKAEAIFDAELLRSVQNVE
jgi:hypothetical protein